MGKVAILTDSNSGITQAQSKELGVKVIPMPFFIDGEQYFEDINLTQEEFYEKLKQDADISTSQPSIGEMQDAFDELLKEYDELVYINHNEKNISFSKEYDFIFDKFKEYCLEDFKITSSDFYDCSNFNSLVQSIKKELENIEDVDVDVEMN